MSILTNTLFTILPIFIFVFYGFSLDFDMVVWFIYFIVNFIEGRMINYRNY